MPPQVLSQKIIDNIIVVCTRQNYTERHYRYIEPFLNTARWIPRGCSPYLDFDNVIAAGWGAPDSSEDDLAYYHQIISMNPRLAPLIEALRADDEDGDTVKTFIEMMSEAISESHAQDTSTIKANIVNYLPFDPITEHVHPAIITTSKAARGWAHKWTARALCPFRDREEFDQDPTLYMKQVQDGTIHLDAKDFPSFLFPHDAKYNPNDKSRGLMRGHVFIRALRAIYTGESSAFTGIRTSNKKSIVELNNVREVMPHMAVNAACQVYVGLSSLPQWKYKDGYFHVERFGKILLKLFTANPNHPWVKDTLDFLTKQLPDMNRRSKRPSRALESEEEDDDDDPTGILAQWAASSSSPDNQVEEETNVNPTVSRPGTPNLTHPPSPSFNRSPTATPPPPSSSLRIPNPDSTVSSPKPGDDEEQEEELEEEEVPPPKKPRKKATGTSRSKRGAGGRTRGKK